MKRKLKSPYKSPKGIIVLAVVLLANVAIFAPLKVEGQRTNPAPQCATILVDCEGIGTGDRLICVRGGDIQFGYNCGDMSPCFGGWR